jgi:uncharacterized protein (DUF1015 family)
MGDGNHSLATAKAIREEKKKSLSAEEQENNHARFALVELVNIHDDGLEFEPIHRVIFNSNPETLINEMKSYFNTQESEVTMEIYPTFEEMNQHKKNSDPTTQYFFMMYAENYIITKIENPKLNLEVGNLQSFLDNYLKAHTETKIDYVHGAQVTEQLGTQQ